MSIFFGINLKLFRNCLFICKVSSYFKEFVYFVVREFQRVPSLRTADKEFILFVRNESYFNGVYKLLGSLFFQNKQCNSCLFFQRVFN
mgnify:CR=1 FL=1